MFRELLFYGDLRVISLPYEFNFTQLTYIDILSDWFCAPRMLHFIGMREHVTNSGTRHLSVQDIVGQKRWRFLARHRRNDAYLTGNSDPSELKPLLKRGLSGWLRSLGV